MRWLQRHWDARAAANFMLGGAGSGLVVVAAFSAEPLAVLLGLLLVCTGLGAVWLEIGRKLRALHVLFNPITSWMTREAFAALALLGCGEAWLLLGHAWLLYAAALFAAAFLYCQARLLQAAKGIPAWRARETVPLLVCTGLAEGAALAVLLGEPVAAFPLLVVARHFAWYRYHAVVRSPALDTSARVQLWLGTAAPLALVFFAPPLAALAALAAGLWLKFALVTRASLNQGYSLPHLPVRGAR